jgi:hypothetical protein
MLGVGCVFLAGAATVVAIFVAPRDRAAELVDLVSSIAWPSMILLGLILFWPEVRDLVTEIRERIRRGSSFGFGLLNVGAALQVEAARIPSPGEGESVKLENIALLHTSFLRPDKTQEFNDGRPYYQFEVIVIAPRDVTNRIESVTYYLPAPWPDRLRRRTTSNRADRFKMKDLANGTLIVTAEVQFKGSIERTQLNRFVDLRPDGPRLA